MTTTHKQHNYRHNKEEQRQSRLKQTRAHIQHHNLSGMLNNRKWHELLSWLRAGNTSFSFTTFLYPEVHHCRTIYELERSALLVETTGNYIAFFEISTFSMPKTDSGLAVLKALRMEYEEHPTTLEVVCYR
jgi:hypothetical protein